MKILFTAYIVDPDVGSEPQCAWEWIQAAVLEHHDVHVITTPESADLINLKANQMGRKNLRAYPVPVPKECNFLNYELNMYIQYRKWQKSLSYYVTTRYLQDVDIAHHLSWGNIGLGTGLSKLNIPYVFGPAGGGTVADTRLKYFFGKDWKTEKLRTQLRRAYLFSPFSRRSARKAQIVLAANDATYKLAKRLGAKKIQLFLPDGIRVNQILKVRVFQTDLTAIYVARFMLRKGANLAILAFAETLKQFPNARLTMVGDGPEWNSCQELVKELGIEDSVTFTGRIPWDEVQQRYKQARVFIFSSLRDTIGAQVLEAAAKGVPIITLENSGVSQWLPPGGAIVSKLGSKSETIKNLSNSINQVFYYSKEEWLNSSKIANNWAVKNSWKSKTSEMNEIYKEIYRSWQ